MEPESILVENLRTALDRIQKYIVLGIGSALFLVLLVKAMPRLAETGERVALPGGFVGSEPQLAGVIVLAVYWVAGVVASYTISRAERIVDELKAWPAILEAILTYPSIATTRIYGPRIGAALLPVVLLAAAMIIEGGWPSDIYSFIGLLILFSPYIAIAIQLRSSIGGHKADKIGD